ncbi:hypothetical protein EWE75_24715 [Sphingomonas populi]|uniref:Uncharacterized protein n=1 Tax=Sphingomonas populi TaxID=2484750 RepID=A0A4Q6XGA8_9SPHN|nr:hypothetical protein [Sphingomonas populi]RZF58045.1 hypothetical protein EWE75_24715 [Sphingomonas populi]
MSEGSDISQPQHPSRYAWAIATGTGLIAWIAVGWHWTDGGGEITAILASTFILMTDIFWDDRKQRWFQPLIFGWIIAHAAILFFWILPLGLHRSKEFLPLYPVDGFALFGLFYLVKRVWGSRADGSETG